MNLMAVMLGKKQYAAALVVVKLENPVSLIGGAPFVWGMTKMLSFGVLSPDHRIFRFRIQPDCAREFRRRLPNVPGRTHIDSQCWN